MCVIHKLCKNSKTSSENRWNSLCKSIFAVVRELIVNMSQEVLKERQDNQKRIPLRFGDSATLFTLANTSKHRFSCFRNFYGSQLSLTHLILSPTLSVRFLHISFDIETKPRRLNKTQSRTNKSQCITKPDGFVPTRGSVNPRSGSSR